MGTKLKTPKEILNTYVKGDLERDYDEAQLKHHIIYLSSALKAIKDAQSNCRVFYNDKHSELNARLEKALENNSEQSSIAAGAAEDEMKEKIIAIIQDRVNIFLNINGHYPHPHNVEYNGSDMALYLKTIINQINTTC